MTPALLSPPPTTTHTHTHTIAEEQEEEQDEAIYHKADLITQREKLGEEERVVVGT